MQSTTSHPTSASNWINLSEAAISDDVTTREINVTTSLPEVPGPSSFSGLVDDATRDAFVEAVNCYLLPVVFVFGVSGNVMSFVVLLVHGMDNSTNVLLLGVTVSDFCYLVSMYARKVSCLVSHVDTMSSMILETTLIPNVHIVNRIFTTTTPFLTMLISLERCLAVILPFKVQDIVTSFRMKIVVSVIFLFSITAQLPFFFIYEIHWTTDQITGQSVPKLKGTEFFYENFDAITAYNNAVLSAVFNYVPMAVIVVCTIVVLTTIKKSVRWRKATSQGGERQEEGRMTKLLMTVVAVFICCYVPRCAVLIANSLAPLSFSSMGGRYGNLFSVFSALQFLLYSVNSSSNFVIYMVMSRKFFRTYTRIFGCRGRCGIRETSQGGMTSSNIRVTSITSASIREDSTGTT